MSPGSEKLPTGEWIRTRSLGRSRPGPEGPNRQRAALERIDQQVVRQFGITNLPQRAWLLESRAASRAAQLGLDGIGAYASYLSGPGGTKELTELFEALRVGQTAWMRHSQSLELLTKEWFLKGKKHLTVWSAGCGTGQEVYSVAMILLEANVTDFHILGTDLSRKAVEQAAQGRYDAGQAESLASDLRKKYWIPLKGGIEPGVGLRRRCSFARHNLLSDPLPEPQDAILCRNVLMYFEPAAAQLVLDRLVSALKPGGVLILGPSELGNSVARRLEPVRMSGGVAWWAPKKRAANPTGPIVSNIDGKVSEPALVGADTESKKRKSTIEAELSALVRQTEAAAPHESNTESSGSSVQSIRLEGAYPVERLAELESALSGLLRAGGQQVLLDLDGATFLCDEAARVIMRAARHMDAFGGALSLLAEGRGVSRWVERCGLGHLLHQRPGRADR